MLGFLSSRNSGQLTKADMLGSERWYMGKSQIRAMVDLGRCPLGDCQRKKNAAVVGEKHLILQNGALVVTRNDGRP